MFHDVVHDVTLVFRANDNVNSWNIHNPLRFELCVASRYGNEGTRVVLDELAYGLAAFMVCHFGYGACVNDADISCFAFLGFNDSVLCQLQAYSGGLCEVELASEGVERNFFAL